MPAPRLASRPLDLPGRFFGHSEEERQDWMKDDSRLEKPWRVFWIVTNLNDRPLKRIQKFLEFITFS